MQNLPTDHRLVAKNHVDNVVEQLRARRAVNLQPLIEECEGLSRAIAAFHMEGIRFRMYNVDRMMQRHPEMPAELKARVSEARRALEAAGFHTRSHQAPT